MDHDVVVVGAGPNGLAVLHALRKAGLDAIGVDKGDLCENLTRFPRDIRFFSTAERLTLDDGQMGDGEGSNPSIQEVIDYFVEFTRRHDLSVLSGHELTSLTGADGDFRLLFKNGTDLRSRKVVLVTGVFGQPKYLGIPGESESGLSHYYEGATLKGEQVLVVGGGNSAAEAALGLADENKVTLAFRRSELDRSRIKRWVLEPLEKTEVRLLPSSEIQSVTGGVARFQSGKEIPFTRCYLLVGHEPDRDLLGRIGLEMDGDFPRCHPETRESSRPGVYVAGSLLRGVKDKREIMEKGRFHGPPIADHIRGALSAR